MKKGFTFVELMVSVGLIVLLAVLAVPALRIFQQQQNVGQKAQEIMGVLRSAQSKTVASEGSSSYGVYFNTGSIPHQYTLFKGSTFAARDVSVDETYKFPSTLEFFNVNVAGNQVVFDRLTGFTSQPGNISVRLKSDTSQTRTVYVESVGQIGIVSPAAYSDTTRIKDSRHVHIDYTGRTINTATESVRLIFPGVTQDIPITSNMQNGQVYWTGTIVVSGQNQTLTIATHALNDAGLHTQFSIYRDARYNTQALTVQLTGDASGNIIVYSSSGQTTKGTSIYVSTPIAQ